MKWAAWLLTLLLSVAGCVTTDDERVRDYSADGLHLFRCGNYLAARESYQAALVLRPEDVGLMYNVAQCYDRQGASAQAEKLYNDCLQRDPNHAACRHALAELLVHEGRQNDAARMAQEWLVREPKRSEPYALDGWLWHQKGDLPMAQARLQQALEIEPHNVHALTELALIYEAMQRQDRAEVIYERVLQLEPDNVAITQRYNMLLTKGAKHPQPE
jgi:Flp pilus assembly protein TadD